MKKEQLEAANRLSHELVFLQEQLERWEYVRACGRERMLGGVLDGLSSDAIAHIKRAAQADLQQQIDAVRREFEAL